MKKALYLLLLIPIILLAKENSEANSYSILVNKSTHLVKADPRILGDWQFKDLQLFAVLDFKEEALDGMNDTEVFKTRITQIANEYLKWLLTSEEKHTLSFYEGGKVKIEGANSKVESEYILKDNILSINEMIEEDEFYLPIDGASVEVSDNQLQLTSTITGDKLEALLLFTVLMDDSNFPNVKDLEELNELSNKDLFEIISLKVVLEYVK
ncbi:hypothetical protein [Bacteroides coprosuis]|uniref:hypothetical protein n=1 Tax=Bacteroides coprosuis TaxID=151276 RepID=UPI001DD23AFF|nr:hypothetical protein [Bacteroides coprosuis]HJD93056.1 hypothetical protein [Bacteroides coprosuis]